MPDPLYYAFIQAYHSRECAPVRNHHGALAPMLMGDLREWAERHDAKPNPRYFVDVRSRSTNEPVFRGKIRGQLAPILTGEMMERALVIDAGKRLNRVQRREADHATRH